MNSLFKDSIRKILDLDGKVAIVTGGAVGIGEAIAYRLAELNAKVLITDVDAENGKKTANKITDNGGIAEFKIVDVSDLNMVRDSVVYCVEQFKKVDILVNNAGIFPMRPIWDIDQELWDRVMDINLKGSFFYAKEVAKMMKSNQIGGKIINIASIDAFHPTGSLIHYDSSKGGMIMMTKALALELAPFKINVNAIAPGGVSTPGADEVQSIAKQQMEKAGMQEQAIQDAFTARIPFGRMGQPDEIARAVIFLATDLCSYVTGETIIVDGGYLLS
ncbi:MAG: Short-chain dehydrogenase [Promethearchaeota archaeon]|nr:MAG: Short-chain dehydrogenase [Candidatus Lokiarchaeota archaeon]